MKETRPSQNTQEAFPVQNPPVETFLNAKRLLFWAIIIFGTTIRLNDLSTGLPLHSLYGETDTIAILRHMLQTRDLNPFQFDLPGFAYYLFLPFLFLFYQAGHLTGQFVDLNAVSDASLLFVGRAVCALFGAASLPVLYRIAKQFGSPAALISMGILAAVPQHIEYSLMLRPEVPAVFFVLLAIRSAQKILTGPEPKYYRMFGIWMGLACSLKYMIGLPLFSVILIVHLVARKQSSLLRLAQTFAAFLLLFILTNPFLVFRPESGQFWSVRLQALYLSGEDYYGKSMIAYYIEFLTRYNYNVPLMILAGFGMILTLAQPGGAGLSLVIYPLLVFLWLCSFEIRRTHGLIPLHPFMALWAGLALGDIWKHTKSFSRSIVFSIGYGILISAVLFWPYYRSAVQSYLFSQLDNRSKAELWMTNRLPRGSRIAVLQFNQVELDSGYFQIENFVPRDYVLNNKDFEWFRANRFDYIVVSSGQYMKYFTEGEAAQKYEEYFTRLFRIAENEGTLVLDLITHPLLIPDYRIKVFSTRKVDVSPAFLPAINVEETSVTFPITAQQSTLRLEPGYYALRMIGPQHQNDRLSIRNLKLNEVILKRNTEEEEHPDFQKEHYFPFSIFPLQQNSQFNLLAPSQHEIDGNQSVLFQHTSGSSQLFLERIPPAIRVPRIDFFPQPTRDLSKPYVLFAKNTPFQVRCHLRNRSNINVMGYIEAYLSQVGIQQPWKYFELESSRQEFFLEPNQKIAIDIAMNTENLTGDFQLSSWVFTQQDVPFSPQNGGWFNKQIRVNDPKLGIHPIYGVPIP